MFKKIETLISSYPRQPSNRMVRKEVVEVINKVVGCTLPIENTTFSDGVIYVRARPALRAEIHMHGVDILTRLREKTVTKDVRAIR